jgi:hypothetical protein
MNIIAEIEERLKKYPQLSAVVEINSISVEPENGFTVWVTENDSSWTVGFEGWHEEFSDPEEALNCFAWGLSNDCRLEVTYRGGKPHKWVAQNLDNGQWVNSSTTGLIFFPFWRRAKIIYKKNAVINS